MVEKTKRMSDIQPEVLPIDEKIDKDSILDRDMIFVEFQEGSGKFGDFLFVVVTELKDDRRLGFSTGATVVCQKLIKARDNGDLPIIGKLIKKEKYYDII